LPFLLGEKQGAPHQALFWRNYDAKRFAIRTTHDKMIIQPDGSFLFDIEKDIGEQNNLKGAQQEKVGSLIKIIDNWESHLKNPAFMGLLQDKEYSRLHPDRFINKKYESKNEQK
jgi:hypothetical protein